jgi:hypothetical protein
MNDDARTPELDEHALLALDACLAGTADDDQRALVADSPDLQHHLARMSEASALIGDFAVPAAVRDHALSAALAVFDIEILPGAGLAAQVHVAGGSTPSGMIVSFTERHRRRTRMLMAAAAAVVVLGIGGAVLRANNARSTPRQADPVVVATVVVATDIVAGAAVEAKTPAPAAAAPAPVVVGAAEPSASADTSAGSAATPPQPTIGYIPGPGTVVSDISSPDELASYVANIAPLSAVTTGAGNTAESNGPATVERVPCADNGLQIIGRITYRGVPALAARSLESGAALALALDTCRQLAESPAP